MSSEMSGKECNQCKWQFNIAYPF